MVLNNVHVYAFMLCHVLLCGDCTNCNFKLFFTFRPEVLGRTVNVSVAIR